MNRKASGRSLVRSLRSAGRSRLRGAAASRPVRRSHASRPGAAPTPPPPLPPPAPTLRIPGSDARRAGSTRRPRPARHRHCSTGPRETRKLDEARRQDFVDLSSKLSRPHTPGTDVEKTATAAHGFASGLLRKSRPDFKVIQTLLKIAGALKASSRDSSRPDQIAKLQQLSTQIDRPSWRRRRHTSPPGENTATG